MHNNSNTHKTEPDSLLSDSDKIRGWGTKLDKLENKALPSIYIGKSFHEANHDDIKTFFEIPNIEKWKMAYWIERQSETKASRMGFVIGLISGIILVSFILKFINSI